MNPYSAPSNINDEFAAPRRARLKQITLTVRGVLLAGGNAQRVSPVLSTKWNNGCIAVGRSLADVKQDHPLENR